ncbi:hypothetical protein QYM36_005656 [Artemia franciscana]|uniref:Uncharacterized protein n=1 Tax=Artemia franciscana TaxID=6661 RepID=A0AA88IAS6_ARTSF|nr:hypothetical protein QYM36_005656 [Artemia franciscana]
MFHDIQMNWEQENSVYIRFGSMNEVMKRFFLDFAKGLEDVDLMASRFEHFFSRHTYKAFESEVEAVVMTNMRKKRWVQSPKYVQGQYGFISVRRSRIKRTQPMSEYRQYLISRYNVEIAKYYSVNPSDAVDSAENLDVVTSKIKRRLDFFKDFHQQ